MPLTAREARLLAAARRILAWLHAPKIYRPTNEELLAARMLWEAVEAYADEDAVEGVEDPR